MILEKNLPKLTGSTNQVKWAENIRKNFITRISEITFDKKPYYNEEKSSLKTKTIQKITSKIETETSSSFWINNQDFDQFYKDVYKKKYVKQKLVNSILESQKNENAANAAKVYISCSFDGEKQIGGYGILLLSDEHIEEMSETVTEEKIVDGWNISVKMAAAIRAMNLCLKHNIKNVDFYHDLNIFETLTRKESSPEIAMTKHYKKTYWELKEQLNINFIKIEPTVPDENFEIAKNLARKAINKLEPLP